MDVFTVGFERDGFSEIGRAHETATALGLRHHSVVVGVEEFAACLPRIAIPSEGGADGRDVGAVQS